MQFIDSNKAALKAKKCFFKMRVTFFRLHSSYFPILVINLIQLARWRQVAHHSDLACRTVFFLRVPRIYLSERDNQGIKNACHVHEQNCLLEEHVLIRSDCHFETDIFRKDCLCLFLVLITYVVQELSEQLMV